MVEYEKKREDEVCALVFKTSQIVSIEQQPNDH